MKPDKDYFKEYINGLKTLQKTVRILQKNGIRYYGASCHHGLSIHVESTPEELASVFTITKTEENGENLFYSYADIDGTIVKLTI